MEISGFIANINKFIKDSLKATEVIDVQPHKDSLERLIGSFQVLIDFLQEDKNISVLKKYENLSDTEQHPPLEFLSKSVLEKFLQIDKLIQPGFYHIEPNLENSHTINSLIPFNLDYCSRLIEILSNYDFLDLLSAFKILKHLDGHNKTLVVLGPNGSGKTSLANHLKKVDKHVKVIPASKPISTNGGYVVNFQLSIDKYNETLYDGDKTNTDLMQSLITGMCNEHDNVARAFMDTNQKESETIYEKVKKIFDVFFDVSLDNSRFSSKELCAKKEGIKPYRFNGMSDGERAAFFYIATVIAAPIQSFIIVDEPENHLNPAVYNKIWDRLIEARKDCQFIFITHTIDFVCARSNYELVRIKEFEYPDKFEFDFLGDSIEKIQSENIVEIVGSRKPILFCEGNKTGLDYSIFESLFGENFTIIPVGGCSSVKNSVEACNLHAHIYSLQSAVGIIDSDLKSEEELNSLMEKKIYTLKLNEIEMLLVDDDVIKAVSNRVFKSENEIEQYKDSFFRKIDERKLYIVKRLTKTIIDEKLNHTNIDDAKNTTKEQFKANLNSIFTSIDIDKIWDDCERKITRMVKEKNYDEALRYCCLEHGEIVGALGNRLVDDYKNMALGVIRTDSALSQSIRNKYFKDIDAYLMASST